MIAYKVVGRYRSVDEQSSWVRGIPGLQAKKRVYINKEDFDKYSPELIERWREFCKYDVEVYKHVDGKWVIQEDW